MAHRTGFRLIHVDQALSYGTGGAKGGSVSALRRPLGHHPGIPLQGYCHLLDGAIAFLTDPWIAQCRDRHVALDFGI